MHPWKNVLYLQRKKKKRLPATAAIAGAPTTSSGGGSNSSKICRSTNSAAPLRAVTAWRWQNIDAESALLLARQQKRCDYKCA
mmetsp:Transcript_115072/g.223567  ORF Transcript_115072/g.223567 Transcript_115072/m.223567 type:complete len:83 (-) Transcript_115072:2064-2312(-)